MRLLIVDNHDSFTFNLVEYVRRVTNTEPTVVPNDTPPWASVDLAAADAVLISPGPGTPPANPADLGITADVLREFDGPILGVCLGLQAWCTSPAARSDQLRALPTARKPSSPTTARVSSAVCLIRCPSCATTRSRPLRFRSALL